MRRNSPHSFLPNKSGFTLIEVIMALVIGAIILTVVNMAFFGTHRKIETVTNERQTYQMVRIVMDRIVKDLVCAYMPSSGDPPKQFSEEEISMYRFVGTDDSSDSVDKDGIHFTTTADLGLPGNRGGTCDVGYYLKEMESKKDRYALIRSEDCLPHQGVSETGKEMEVGEGVISMDIKYIDGESQENDAWDLADKLCLPKEVKVTITFDVEGKPLSFTGVAFLPLSDLPKLVRGQEEAP